MKKIIVYTLFITVLCLANGSVCAQTGQLNISLPEASVAAEHIVPRLSKSGSHITENPRVIYNNDQMLAYVFDLVPTGYIIVSASRSLPPVLAYSAESNFGDFNNHNPLFSMLRADIINRMSFAETPENFCAEKYHNQWSLILSSENSAYDKQTLEQWPADSDGWLKTNWTQNAPYNLYCPLDPVTSQRSIAGCPAVAMAQILNFHKTTNKTQFDDTDDYYHSYAGRQYWIDDDHLTHGFPSFSELNEALDTLNAHYLNGTQLSDHDKAALTFAGGVACKQVFTSQASGTFGVSQAYDAYVRFGFSTVSLLDGNDTDLYERLKQNIKDTLPAHLAVVDSAWSMGHNVVVDGYNTDDYYHINFGWGGTYNGWYLLPDEIPYGLTVVEGIVLDIIPTDYTGIQPENLQKCSVSIFPNPASDLLTVSLSGFPDNQLSFHLFDINSRKVKSLEVSNTAEFQITIKDLSGGIYFYNLSDNNEITERGKIVIE
jgi:hypothetical protein